MAVFSLMGAWIVSVPYEGQILYTLSENFSIDSYELLKVSLIMQAVGLIAGGMFLKNTRASKWLLMIAIPFCIVCTLFFCFESFLIRMIALMACSAAAGVCIAACGYFFKICTNPGRRFSAAATLVIVISVLKLMINLVTLFLSLYAGIVFSAIVLGTASFFAARLPDEQPTNAIIRPVRRKKLVQAMILLCLFISVTTIDFGIMVQSINPQFKHIEWLTSWYWLIPYIASALMIKRIRNSVDRGNLLYIALGMIGFAFILFLILEKTVASYLIIFTLMMAAWAVYDVFWWSMLGEMLEMYKNAALILGIGFTANVLGVLNGKMIGKAEIALGGTGNTLLPLAVICVTLVILPILHRSLSLLVVSNSPAPAPSKPEGASRAAVGDVSVLTEREKQIADLLLKGKTGKLIAAELYLSENTVKTHIKNIYAKLGVRRKSDLFNKLMT